MKTSDFLPLIIMPEARKTMTNHAVFSFPDECVGFIFGVETGQKRIVTRAIQTCNVKEGDKRRRFQISPLSYMKAEKYALQHGLTLLGIYHSHPLHPAVPSEHDLKQAVPYFSYPIISVTADNIQAIRSWQLGESGEFAEEILEPFEAPTAITSSLAIHTPSIH